MHEFSYVANFNFTFLTVNLKVSPLLYTLCIQHHRLFSHALFSFQTVLKIRELRDLSFSKITRKFN